MTSEAVPGPLEQAPDNHEFSVEAVSARFGYLSNLAAQRQISNPVLYRIDRLHERFVHEQAPSPNPIDGEYLPGHIDNFIGLVPDPEFSERFRGRALSAFGEEITSQLKGEDEVPDFITLVNGNQQAPTAPLAYADWLAKQNGIDEVVAPELQGKIYGAIEDWVDRTYGPEFQEYEQTVRQTPVFSGDTDEAAKTAKQIYAESGSGVNSHLVVAHAAIDRAVEVLDLNPGLEQRKPPKSLHELQTRIYEELEMLAGLFVLEDIDVLDEQHVDAAYQGKAWHTMQAKLGHSVFKHICSQAVATASQRFAEEFSISRIKEFMKGFEPEIAAFWAEKRATYADEPEEIEVYDEPEDIEPGTPQPQLVEHGGHDHLYIPMVGESTTEPLPIHFPLARQTFNALADKWFDAGFSDTTLNATFDFMTKRALADGDDFNPTQVFRMLQSWFDPARLGPDAEPEDSAWNVVFSKEVNMLTTIYENGGMQFENDQGGLVITMAAVPDIHPV